MKQEGSPYDPLFERIADLVADRVLDRLDRPGRPSQRRLLTVDQAAEYLARSPLAVRHLINRRVLPAVRHGRRVFLDRADLDSFIERTKVFEG
jgi:excisionase family DNA binding protein